MGKRIYGSQHVLYCCSCVSMYRYANATSPYISLLLCVDWPIKLLFDHEHPDVSRRYSCKDSMKTCVSVWHLALSKKLAKVSVRRRCVCLEPRSIPHVEEKGRRLISGAEGRRAVGGDIVL